MEYKTQRENKNTTNEYRYFLDQSLLELIDCLFRGKAGIKLLDVYPSYFYNKNQYGLTADDLSRQKVLVGDPEAIR